MRLYVYCEGPTEREFVNRVLSPYLDRYSIQSIPIVCSTGKVGDKKSIGGISSYGKVHDELIRICGEHHNELVTTMIDYYGLPGDTPGVNKDIVGCEHDISADLSCDNLIVYLSKHEFEALLFSDPKAFGFIYPKSINKMEKIRDSYPTPEDINNSYETAPSRRIKKIIHAYSKVNDGVFIAEKIGVESMMAQCPHFKGWIKAILERCS